MTDEPDTAELENRIEKLEATIEKMMPSRRDALKMGGAALAGGSLMAGTASAGTNQVGTIGDKDATPPKRVDLHSEDIDNADTITTDSLTATNNQNTGALNTDKLSINNAGTLYETDSFVEVQSAGLVEPVDSFTNTSTQTLAEGSGFFDLGNIPSAAAVYGKFSLIASIDNGNETLAVRPVVLDSNVTQTVLNSLELTTQNTGSSFLTTGWVDLAATGINLGGDLFLRSIQGSVTGGTGTIVDAMCGLSIGWRIE